MHIFVFVDIYKKKFGRKKTLVTVVTNTHVYVGTCVGLEPYKKDRNRDSAFSLYACAVQESPRDAMEMQVLTSLVWIRACDSAFLTSCQVTSTRLFCDPHVCKKCPRNPGNVTLLLDDTEG